MTRDPDTIEFGVTPMQVRVLMNVDDQWRNGTALNNGQSIGNRVPLLSALARAGLVQERRKGHRTQYRSTPAGLEFRTYLERLEVAREP